MEPIDEFMKKLQEKASVRNRKLGREEHVAFVGDEGAVGGSDACVNSEKTPLIAQQQQANQSGSSSRILLEKTQLDLTTGSSASKTVHHFSTTRSNESSNNSNVGIEISVTTEPGVGVHVEVEEAEIPLESENIQPSQQANLRDTSRNRLQRLGVLYSNNDISSPIHRTEEAFSADDNNGPGVDFGDAPKPKQRFGKLMALANTINEWEDDLTHHDLKRVQAARQESPCRVFKKGPAPPPPVPQPKSRNWDTKLLNNLEAQGFERRDDKMVYDYAREKPAAKVAPAKPSRASEATPRENKSNLEPVVSSGLVSGRAALFEQRTSTSQQAAVQQELEKDPSEMSLRDRLKIFERNKSGAMLPKAPITLAPTLTQLREQQTATIAAFNKQNSQDNEAFRPKSVSEKVAALAASVQAPTENQRRIEKERQEDMKIISSRFSKQQEIGGQPDARKMAPPPPPPPPPMPRLSTASVASLSTAKRRSSTDNSDSDAKRQRHLYPSLSPLKSSDNNNADTATMHSSNDDDVGSSESDVSSSNMEMDSLNDTTCSNADLANTTLGRKVAEAVEAAQQHLKKSVHFGKSGMEYDSSLNSTSVGSEDMDGYLNEALGESGPTFFDDSESESDNINTSRVSKGKENTVTSSSFLFQKTSKVCPTINECEVLQTPSNSNSVYRPPTSNLSVETSEDVVKLVHTVSIYRRQQNTNSAGATPYRKITRERDLQAIGGRHKLEFDDSPQQGNARNQVEQMEADEVSAEGSEQVEEDAYETQVSAARVEEKIKKMLEEITKQQTMIGQTSQAINLCLSTVEFAGSTEAVEFERVLLLATHRRQACLDEVQRLRVDKTLRATNHPNESGTLTVSEITIPLRQDYLRQMAIGSITGHHLVCLLKYNEHVLATKAIPTMPGLITVKFPDTLKLTNVYADFLVTLEIYGMVAHREQLPHDVKYHINVNKKGGSKTPKKKGGHNVLVRPPIQSPAGPNAVRSPQFVRYAYAIFSLREINRTACTLTETTPLTPLDQTVHMKMNCELTVSLEYRGFLTMFDEISGFGAWHRRWCCLNGTTLKYWKYPDDEKRKSPMGCIDLHKCTTKNVSVAPRDLCARLNTILLESQRPAVDTDRESLIVVPNGDTTTIRYLLSADTKDDRDEWVVHLNKALLLARAWGRSDSRN